MSYFIFKGISSEEMGLIIEKNCDITKPNRKYLEFKVEGRDGLLTKDLGTYECTTKEFLVHLIKEDMPSLDYLLDWLDGEGELISSTLHNRHYIARVDNEIPLEQIIENGLYKFPIRFKCQPFSYRNKNDVIQITEQGTAISNSCTRPAKPCLTVFGNGTINLSITSDRGVYQITLKDVVDSITINTDTMQCYKGLENCNSKMTGKFPILQKGKNTFEWSGGTVTKIEVTPNLGYLI
ncbi:phage tail domain-containing protein [Clostridium perfringens]|uniref:phage tail domain-containing protein n=1 Tax=Clostridium perfringens TaxID=1502 RepID=UPI00123F6300|nr:phage tail domain-containing protein [Clostridium perfringens]EGT4138009.1 hypothetical protein [Clostridium perfringens]